MSYYFGKRSVALLEQLDERLVSLMCASIATSPIDFTIVETKRILARQKDLFLGGFTTTLKSKHLNDPLSLAVDVAPIVKSKTGRSTIPWDRPEYFYYLAGVINSTYKEFFKDKFQIKWGGDWNGNGIFVKYDKKETFTDLCHWELM